MFLMLSGNYPFKGVSERELYQKITRGTYSMLDCIPVDARKLIARMLSVEGYKRPNIKEVCSDKWML